MAKELEKIKSRIRSLLIKNGIKKAGIFGSYARGDYKRGSDIDILINAPKDFSLFDVAGLEISLEKALGKKVDLLTYNSLNSLLKERILKEEIRIL